MPDNKYVILCRGDEHFAEIEVFGLFDSHEDAECWVDTEKENGNCPNEHEITEIHL